MNSHEEPITFSDGATTILERWGSSGPNVLCLHGMTSSRKTWLRTAGAMELAYSVYAYDQRGHGDAAAFPGPMTFERIVRDCVEIADAIPGGVDTLLGHSWGGAIVILAGLQMPVPRVVAIDPMFHERPAQWAPYWHEQMDALLALHGKAREERIVADYRNRPGYREHPEELEGKIHALRTMTIDPLIAIGIENGAEEGKLDLRESIVNYPRPLLFMLADPKDSVVLAEDVAFIREHGGRNVTVREFPGTPHSLQRTHFDDYLRVLNAFVGVPA